MNDHTDSDCVRILKQVAAIEPPPEVLKRTVERTLEALTDAQISAGDTLPVIRKHGNQHFLRTAIATAAVLAVSVGGIYFFLFASNGATSAFAGVQAAIKKVSCMSFSIEVLETPKNVVAKSGTSMTDLENNRFRFESADGNEIYIVDGKHGMSMQLYPNQKRAVVVRSPFATELPSTIDFLEGLRDCDCDLVVQEEDAYFESRRVERYRILPESPFSGGIDVLVSVDPKTRLPVQIEQSTNDGQLGGPLRIVCNNFSYDQLDSTLFATVPPEGYQVDSAIDSANQAVESTTDNLGPPIVKPELSIEFRIVEKEPGEGLIEATVPGNSIEKVYMHSTPIVTRDHIQSYRLSESKHTIEFTFTDAGSALMTKATSQDSTKQVAVLIDGRIIGVPIVHATISKKALITGDFSPDLMQRLSGEADNRQ